jgi:hypothetical protein
MVRMAVPPLALRTLTGLVEPKLRVGRYAAPEGLEVREAVRVTFPVNPPEGVTAMVLVPLLPWMRVRLAGEGERVKPGGRATVTMRVVDAVRPPEVPDMVTVEAPVAAEALAVRVRTLDPVVEVGAKAAVTPLGSPEAASVTLPVNPPAPVTVRVPVALLPCARDNEEAEAESVKLCGGLTVREKAVDAVRLPEVPVIVTVEVPAAAEALAVSVRILDPVVEVGAKDAVTPLGSPEAARVTLPLNPPVPATVRVSVAPLP